MYNSKSAGPKMEPWETPVLTGHPEPYEVVNYWEKTK